MKPGFIIKIILLIIPIIVLVFVFMPVGRKTPGIGGGGYDLSKLYYPLFAIGYLVIYELILLINGPKKNMVLLMIGLLLIISLIIYEIITLK